MEGPGDHAYSSVSFKMGWVYYFNVLTAMLSLFFIARESVSAPRAPPEAPACECAVSAGFTPAGRPPAAPRRLGSISPLLMHLRCAVETYHQPNVLVANGASGKIVVDIGVNTGEDFAVPAAAAGHKVYAFEPVRRKFAHVEKLLAALHGNFTVGHLDPSAAVRAALEAPVGQPPPPPPPAPADVTLVWAAAGSEPGFVAMKQHAEDGSMDHIDSERGAGSAGANVPMVPLSAVVPLDARIYLLKVDTEGHDGQALRGAEPWLRRGAVDFVYFEMNPALMERAKFGAVATLDYLAQFDYACMEATLSQKMEPYLLRTANAAEYIEHRLPWYGKPTYGGGPFSNVLCVHESWLFTTRVREGGSVHPDQDNSAAASDWYA